jgi:hypothetical protein
VCKCGLSDFGKELFDDFCEKNNLHLVFRGHQVFEEGIKRFFNDSFISFFSASDYVKKKIRARYIEIDTDDIYSFKVYVIQEHLPG